MRFDWRHLPPLVAAAVAFALAAAAYAWMQAPGRFPDPDSFYHAAMGWRLAHGELVRAFPWLPLTTLATAFADHHFLYHVALVPFVAALGPVAGTRAAAVAFAALAVAVFHFVIRKLEVRHAWLFTFVFATAGSSVFRLNLAKANALAAVLVLLAFLAMRLDRRRALFAVAFLYVWTHGSWPLLLVLAAFDLLAERFAAPAREAWHLRLTPAASRLAAVAGGLLAGLVVNPYFPENLSFYWQQVVRIAVLGHASGVARGDEWTSIGLLDLFARNPGPFLVLAAVLGFLAFAVMWPRVLRSAARVERDDAQGVVLALVMSVALLLMTLRQQRQVEFLSPFLLLAAALLFSALFRRIDPAAARREFRKIFPRPHLPLLAAAFVAFALLNVGVRGLMQGRALFAEVRTHHAAPEIAAALRGVAPAGALVWHDRWDDFPAFFLYAPEFRYVAGLDPQFLASASPERYRLWEELKEGGVTDSAAVMRREFGASYAVVRADRAALIAALAADSSARLVYADSVASIYELR